ncbi:ABC transporter, periplasmic substrate-binding protein [Pseudomonas cannabina]|uniref:ABC transporter, periplasmic substrate-binding protein n=2 Tax=Pseudomonas cannabina TaxID=86840 RepID=A0A0P9L018_PSECA|nr:putative ABC transporter, periplasmic substrate-binding protein [Pseudomonas cannabina]RMN18179.1 ABC transporter, periplasmic substrate-binding protein [Pseudomonas cannabina]
MYLFKECPADFAFTRAPTGLCNKRKPNMKSSRKHQLAVLFLGCVAVSAAAQAEQLKVMTSGGFTAAYKLLGPQYAASSGDSLDTILGPSMGQAPEAIPNRLARGEHADVVIMVGYALDELIKQGKVDPASRVELADSRIGMVVKQGAAKPAIATDSELKETLLNARSVAYSDSASGMYIEKELFKKLGIQQQLAPKSAMIERIPVASVVAKGDYELGFQQVAELLPIPGVTFVAKIPEDVQSVTRYAAGVPVNAEHPKQARALLDYLASPQAQATVQSTGLDSVPR